MIDRTKAPAVHPFGKLTMPSDTVEVLSNGIVFHRFIGGDQPVCRLTIHIAGGISELGEAKAKLLLGMFTEGTSSRSADDIAESIDFNGARLATQAQTHFCVIDLAVLVSQLGDMLPILGDILYDSVFPEERLEITRLRLKNALQVSLHEPSVMADRGLSPLVWGYDNPLAHQMTPEDIDAVDSDMLRHIYSGLKCTARMQVYLSGLLDDSSIDVVRHFLESLPSHGQGYGMQLHPATPASAGSVTEQSMPSTLQCAIACGIPTIGRNHPDYVPLRFTVMALGGYFGSRLMSNIRESKGLTYGISSAVLGGQDGAHVYISTLTDRSNTDRVVSEIRKELAAMAQNPPKGEELERFRTYAMTGLAELLDNPTSVMQYYGSQNLVGAPADYFECQQRVLQSINSEEMARISRQYLDPEALRISFAR